MNRIWNLPFLLEKWLWKKGISHPIMLPLVRNEILAALFCLVSGVLLALYSGWLFWFGFGVSIMALTFYTLAHFFLRIRLDAYSSLLFMRVMIRWCGRLLLTALLLYIALGVCAAPPSAVLAGLVSATLLALVTYAVLAKRI